MRYIPQRLALCLFALYVALFPGSTLTIALNHVPPWGRSFGGVLLVIQGVVVLAWLAWRYGIRGGVAGISIALMGLVVEFLGETTGFPFGRYSYTDLLQPKVFDVVPLAICCAWAMAVPAAYEIAKLVAPTTWRPIGVLLLAATLVLVLDLQIETVAANINNYWIWIDSGPYYGVPTENFVAWWLVGLGMASVLSRILGHQQSIESHHENVGRMSSSFLQLVLRFIPHLMYLLSTLMFAIVNLARGYTLAGVVGVIVLGVSLIWITRVAGVGARQTMRQRYD